MADKKIDSKTRIKEYIQKNFPKWERVDYSNFCDENIEFDKNLSELYKIDNEEIVLISYTNISITGTDRPKPQLRVFLDEYKKPFYFAKKHMLRYYLFSIFTKEDDMARGLDNFNPKEYVISIETNLDTEGARRDLRSIYDYANEKLNGARFLKCSRSNYKADVNQASFIYIGSEQAPYTTTFENFIKIFDSRPYLNSTNDFNTIVKTLTKSSAEFNHFSLLPALRTKPFLLLAGISGTGKSRIVRKLAQATVTKELQEYDGADFDKDRWSLHRPANFELVQVKPNWHNSMDVVGYLSNIPTPHYVFTPFVEFIVKAWMNPDVPFFLCLDEMNLAPVEEYFAEFLSAIESRAFEDGKYATDPIIKPFNSFGKEMGDEMIRSLNESLGLSLSEELSNQFKEKGLSLPNNLLVVGTVNMDETTYSFSRKVLDRAMSIEMNDVNYDNFLADSTDEELKSMLSKFKNINDLLVNRHIEAKDVVVSLGKDAETVIGYLKKINTLLEGTPFKLGYRAANEALIYVAAAKDFGFCDVEAALDQFTLMKILSRLEGDSSKMKVEDNDKRLSLLDYSASDVKDKRAESLDKETITLLTCMHKIIEDFLLPKPKSLEETVTVTDLANPDEGDDKESDDKKKLKSLEKLENMIAQLHRERFVSYWN